MVKQSIDLESTILKSESIYEGKYLTLYKQIIRLPNGEESLREIVHVPNAVGIVALDQDGNLILVRQYREAIRKIVVGIPAGIIDENSKETPLDTAQRELEEETGYRAERIELLVPKYFFAEGFCQGTIELYLARDLQTSTHEPDPTEPIQVVKIPFEEAYQRNLKGEFIDAKTKLALMFAKQALSL